MQPEYAILSYGRNNDYGHPHAETIGILKEHGVETIETGKEKEIRLVSDGKDYRFTFPMKK
jgi:competence protein ComEC